MSDANNSTENGTAHFDTSPRADIFLTANEVELLDYLRNYSEDKWPAVSLSLLRIICRFEDAVNKKLLAEYQNREA